jgi:radical SAM superfamily enzyme YgiQ (UPF0313 family)
MAVATLVRSDTANRVRDVPVCLIIPPSPFLADERVFPFIGPLKVAAGLRRNGNHVEVIDLSGYANYEEIVASYCGQTEIMTFGITATTPQLPSAFRVMKAVRRLIPNARIILGGPHVTMTYTAYQMDLAAGRARRGTRAWNQLVDHFDRLVIGDGELAVYSAIDPEDDCRIIDAGNIKSPLYLGRGTLDEYPPPARDLIDLDSYKYEIDGHPAFSLIAQLGCPFQCRFCGGRDSHVFRVTRSRSTASVIAEIRNVVVGQRDGKGAPLSAVMFYDDELNVTKNGLEDLCRGLIGLQVELGIDMRFRGFVKAELFTQEQAELMHQAGFRMVLSGVESGSNRILDAMCKNTSREINTRCLEFAHGAGMKFKALMSIGHPGESRQTVQESVDWVLENRPDEVDWTIITQYPGSPYYDHSERNGDHWVYVEPRSGDRLYSSEPDFLKNVCFYKGVPGDYTSYVWTDYLSPEELVLARDEAERVSKVELGLPAIKDAAAEQFDHSMGQAQLDRIIRRSDSIG